MNAQPAFESHYLETNEAKIMYETDTKVPNGAIITINKEDHTLGNLLRAQLLRDEKVIFAGYKVPHPLEHKVVLRVQTAPDYTPLVAVNGALTDLMSEFSLMEERLKECLESHHQ